MAELKGISSKEAAFIKFGKELSGVKDKKLYSIPTKFGGPELKSVKIVRELLRELKKYCLNEEASMKDVLAFAINTNVFENKINKSLVTKVQLRFSGKEQTNTNLNKKIVSDLKKVTGEKEQVTMYELTNYAVFVFLNKNNHTIEL